MFAPTTTFTLENGEMFTFNFSKEKLKEVRTMILIKECDTLTTILSYKDKQSSKIKLLFRKFIRLTHF